MTRKNQTTDQIQSIWSKGVLFRGQYPNSFCSESKSKYNHLRQPASLFCSSQDCQPWLGQKKGDEAFS
ncbi:Hypothetical protein P9303_12341 [Prochlorococcus marinus str. MIT 9303]|uniref:Uncharacterized protein n=1 Tax=Prochlorococcus marinus (strain MIT 9303) TaxID=59922 RepID=A2C923_PROM3|nr:Hypothetical protein P9303_12341 [Prochlorococcus marinus str. MIT 9303]